MRAAPGGRGTRGGQRRRAPPDKDARSHTAPQPPRRQAPWAPSAVLAEAEAASQGGPSPGCSQRRRAGRLLQVDVLCGAGVLQVLLVVLQEGAASGGECPQACGHAPHTWAHHTAPASPLSLLAQTWLQCSLPVPPRDAASTLRTTPHPHAPRHPPLSSDPPPSCPHAPQTSSPPSPSCAPQGTRSARRPSPAIVCTGPPSRPTYPTLWATGLIDSWETKTWQAKRLSSGCLVMKPK